MRRFHLPLFTVLLLAAPILQAGSLGDFGKSVIQQYGTQQSSGSALPTSEIAEGIKQALAKGTRTAVNQLGRSGGFWGNPSAQIPLPAPIAKAESFLDKAGAGAQLDQLHESINRAAEQAVPVAADVFSQAVQKLTLNDVRGILNGPQDAATQYFKRTTSSTLTAKFEPIVAQVTAKVGLAQKCNQVMSAAGPMASLLGSRVNLNDYVTQQTLNALFVEVASEEKSIRTNPAARTTEVLKKVFANGG